VADVFAEGIEETVRKTVDTVSALKKNEVSLGELAAKLGARQARHQSPATGRKTGATSSILRPAEVGRRIVLGDPIPEMLKLLPEAS
jgi:hypothetical protein